MELNIFTGIQASGKSTFYRLYFGQRDDCVYVSKDRLRNNPRPERRQRELIAEALAGGRSVVVDNTNPAVADRAALIALGRVYGARIVGYAFASRAGASLVRNRLRHGRERVPDVAIFATLKRLQQPAYTEGFDLLYTVCLTDEQTFLVTKQPQMA
jgi:predicted kinase